MPYEIPLHCEVGDVDTVKAYVEAQERESKDKAS